MPSSELHNIYYQDRHFAEDFREITPEVTQWFPIPENGEVNAESIIKPERVIIPQDVTKKLGEFIHVALDSFSGYSKPKPDGVVIGLSGGVDSSTLAAICQQSLRDSPYFLKGVVMGRGEEGKQGEMNIVEYQDILYALKFAKDMKIDYDYINITPIVNGIKTIFGRDNDWALSGILPRLRGLMLNQATDHLNGIHLGSTNSTEYALTAWTTGGPAGNTEPILGFYKSEVYELARQYSVPDYVINRKPGISELGIYDEQLYGGNCYLIDPILRMLYDEQRTPTEVAKKLGHSINWIQKIYDLRIKGEAGRRTPPYFYTDKFDFHKEPDVQWDRSYLTELF